MFAHAGIYNDQGNLASDEDEIIFNLRTHQLIGPTNVGFCGIGPSAGKPIGTYGSVPSDILASLGLAPCVTNGNATALGNAPTPADATATATTTDTTAAGRSGLAAFTGIWGAHETALTINGRGVGLMKYADLTRCPNCSMAGAPLGTMAFALKSVSNGVGVGRVTASSDTKNFAVGDSVTATITSGSPGQLLNLDVAGKSLLPFCNSTSVGQCGA